MKGWKLGVAALAICTAASGAWAQEAGWSHVRQTPPSSVVQTQWHDQDRDRNDDRDRDQDRDRHDNRRWRNDRDRRNNTGSYRYGRDDRDRDGDRDRINRNGGYPVYGNNGSNGRSVYGRGGYNNPAAQFGYEDGVLYGQNDAIAGKRYNATGGGAYKNADRGYNATYGDRNSYRQEYRQAFQQGYDDGYNRSTNGRRY